MKIGLVAALTSEIRCLTSKDTVWKRPFRINDTVVAIVCGIGPVHAEKAAENLLQENITGLVSWGTAAGLVENIHSGDLLLPENVVDSVGKEYQTDYTWHPGLHFLKNIRQVKIHTGSLVETLSILELPEHKTDLAKKSGAVSADMETAAIMRVANRHNLPCAVIRSIVDDALTCLPTEIQKHTDDFGTPVISGIVKELFFRPNLVPRLIQLGLAMNAAMKTLKLIADITGQFSCKTS